MNILAVGAHPDDIELGCGGALAHHRDHGDAITMVVLTRGDQGGDSAERLHEQKESALLIGAKLVFGHFPDSNPPPQPTFINFIEDAIDTALPDRVYTHSPRDTHQDHVAVSLATLAAARKIPQVLFYDGPSTINFSPNFFININGYLEQKISYISCHASQIKERARVVSITAIEASARYYGHKAKIELAEGFEVHRFVENSPLHP
jgi:LmbE family N-acetylglucosaminyl deacetylase